VFGWPFQNFVFNTYGFVNTIVFCGIGYCTLDQVLSAQEQLAPHTSLFPNSSEEYMEKEATT
jgi:hypothetical protein